MATCLNYSDVIGAKGTIIELIKSFGEGKDTDITSSGDDDEEPSGPDSDDEEEELYVDDEENPLEEELDCESD